MPEKAWKRPALLAFSLLGTGGFGSGLWFTWNEANVGTLILFAALLGMFVLGIFVSLKGCNACVARLFGSV